MAFQPAANSTFEIDGLTYRVAEHPAAPGVAYGQEGRAGIVYQLIGPDGNARALKVFKPRFQTPALVGLAEKLEAYAEVPGLEVCQRLVLTARRHRELLRRYPELNYAVLMPWVAGPTWMQVVGERRALTPAQSLKLAQGLLESLTAMEERGLAHCDLSGPNTLLPALLDGGVAEPHGVALVDVEQFYGPGLEKPDILPAGSAGYAHRTAPQGLWSARADRFAGAILLAEMLGWCDASVRQAAAGESYFDPVEIHQDSARYRMLVTALRRRWGTPVSALLQHAWESETLADCPNFGQWLTALPETPLTDDEPKKDTGPTDTASDGALAAVRALMDIGRKFASEGNRTSAAQVYQQALALAPSGGLRDEIALILRDLEQKVEAPRRADEELASFFDDGLAAYERRDWAKAHELLSGVSRRQPDYARGGRRAATLLAESEKHQAGKQRSGLRGWGRVLALLSVMGVVGSCVMGLWTVQQITQPPNATSAPFAIIVTPATRPGLTESTITRIPPATPTSKPTNTLAPTDRPTELPTVAFLPSLTQSQTTSPQRPSSAAIPPTSVSEDRIIAVSLSPPPGATLTYNSRVDVRVSYILSSSDIGNVTVEYWSFYDSNCTQWANGGVPSVSIARGTGEVTITIEMDFATDLVTRYFRVTKVTVGAAKDSTGIGCYPIDRN